jgi:hypothetical protein
LLVLLGAVAVALSGCQPAREAKPAAATAQETASQTLWESFYLQGAKIGYGQTTIKHVSRGGQSLVQTESLNHLSITRFGQTSNQDLRMTSLETLDGKLVQFQTSVSFGPVPTVVTGKVVGDKLQLSTATQGQSQTSTLPWSSDIGGFRAVENSLARQPLEPGERRTLRMLMPLVNQVAEVQLTAQEVEDTEILGAKTRLLRIENVAKLPGQPIVSTMWADATGEVLKSHVAALDQLSVRTTETLAKAPGGKAGKLDLGLDLFVQVDPPLKRPHQSKEVVYRIELANADPAEVFASGPTQRVKSLGPHTAEVTVTSVSPASDRAGGEAGAKPSAEYLAANSILQLDDPRLKQMAAEAKGDATRPEQIAVALETYAHDAMKQHDFSQGFATAAEVAESRAGDCTEHAVLLAALARINGLPSRVAIGLVYVESAGAFGYHMWTEVYLHGRWVPLDATVGRGGTSAAYLKLNDSSLEGASAFSSFLSVAQVLGQLKVSVVSAK